jgi:rhodanese-related sulfurtransferase
MEQLITFANNHPLLCAAWAAIVFMIVVISIRIKLSPVKQVSPQELTFLVNKNDGLVIDIRAEKDFKVSHILDSVYFATDKANNNDFTSLEKYKDKPIIVVCTAGLTASKIANQLLKAGFNQVNLLKGGMNAWLAAGLPTAKSKK